MNTSALSKSNSRPHGRLEFIATSALRRIHKITHACGLRVLAPVMLLFSTAHAGEDGGNRGTYWIKDVGDWTEYTNWSAGVPGGVFTGADISNGGTARLFGRATPVGNSTLGNVRDRSGTLEVLGIQARITIDYLYVGSNGTGTMRITGGGEVSTLYGVIGYAAGSTGLAIIDGPYSRWFNTGGVFHPGFTGELDVGYYGTGTLSITGGGVVASTYPGHVGREVGSNGTVTVAGAVSKLTNTSDLFVGHSGAGTLNITAGGMVSNFNANIGANSNSHGTATVDGAGSVWTNNSVLAVGSSGNGALTITAGGVVTSFHGRIARSAGSTGTVLIDGPGSRWNASGAFTMGLHVGLFLVPTATLEVRNGGVLSAASGMTIGQFGVVRGDGTIVANVTNSGYIAPGNSTGASTGTLYINGNFQQSVSGRLQIELAAASFDKLAVTGEITLDNTLFGPPMGGTLDVSLAGDYVPYGTQSFDILDWSGSLMRRVLLNRLADARRNARVGHIAALHQRHTIGHPPRESRRRLQRRRSGRCRRLRGVAQPHRNTGWLRQVAGQLRRGGSWIGCFCQFN